MNPFQQIWTIFKLIYLHIAYVIAGLDQEYFYISRANYFIDFGWLGLAIGNYKKALKESNDPQVLGALGWCYTQLDMLERALEYYSEAYVKSKHPNIALGLAYVEYQLGNKSKFQQVLHDIADSNFELDENHHNEVKRLEGLLTEMK